MREVAAEAGVSLRQVQYYFHTKEELLTGTLRRLGDQLAARVQRRVAAVAATPTPGRVLYSTLAAIVPTDDQSRQIMMAYTAFYNYTLTNPGMAGDGLRYADAMTNFLAEKIEQAQTAGEIRTDLKPPARPQPPFSLSSTASASACSSDNTTATPPWRSSTSTKTTY